MLIYIYRYILHKKKPNFSNRNYISVVIFLYQTNLLVNQYLILWYTKIHNTIFVV